MELGSIMAAEESKEKCDWAPLTPAKFVPARYVIDSTGMGLNQDVVSVENPKLPQFRGKLGHEEKESGNYENFGRFGFGNPGDSGLEFLGLNGKPEGIVVGLSGKGPHQETIELEASENGTEFHNRTLHSEFGSDSMKDSNEARNETPKRRKQGKKRLRMKRHRPKVFDKAKIKKSPTSKPIMTPATPKPRTPKRPKFVKNNSLDKNPDEIPENVDRKLVGDSSENICKKKLDFDTKICTTNEISIVFDERESKLVLENVCGQRESKLDMETKLQQSCNRVSSLIVYTRVFKPNECLKNSRKLGPNCPFVFKKARMRRLKATVFDKFIRLVSLIPKNRKRKRAAMHEPVNLDQIVRGRTTKPRTLLSRRKAMTREAVTHLTFEKCTSNLTWMARRKRSKTSTSKKRDLSSFVSDLSKLQLSTTFLSKASTIRIQDTGRDQLAAPMEAQDECIQKNESFEKQRLSQDNPFSFNESIQECPADFAGHMAGFETNFPEHNLDIDKMLDNRSPEKSLDSDVKEPSFMSPYDAFTKALVDFASQMMEGLNIDDDGFNQLVVRNQNGALISPSKENLDPSKKRLQLPKVDLDAETIRVFNLLMGDTENKDIGQEDDEKAKYWKEERALYEGRLDEFIAVMHLIQGDRRFSQWKGSVVDSVVGVFLTQNVSDHLSSSAFMTLAAKYPPSVTVSEHNGSNGINDIIVQLNDSELVKTAEPLSDEYEQLLTIEDDPTPCLINQDGVGVDPKDGNIKSSLTQGRRKGKKENKQETVHWDELRVKYSKCTSRNRTNCTVDSVNWDAVRQTPVSELAKVIMERGMNNLLAARIKGFLDRLVRDHGSIDLEWLRDVPPDKAKEYLLSISGLGLKSVECVRLLALHHQAFPVDVNISRVSTRNAWIPLQPLPEGVQIHLLNQYPDLDSVQQYEAHCHLILFGKTICTKKQPNCRACPFTAKCKHYASMAASARPRLDGFGSHEENTGTQSSYSSSQDSMVKPSLPMLLNLDGDFFPTDGNSSRNCEPIIEIPDSPMHECAPEANMDACTRSLEDIEDFGFGDEMPTLELSFRQRDADEASKALVTLRPEFATWFRPKLKNVERLRTVHHVYELPDSHPLLAGVRPLLDSYPFYEKRELEDPCPYLLAIWMTDETTNFSREPKKANNWPEATKCDTCICSGEIVKYQHEHIVQGTILIPCRTAIRGSFPLNGTYFQVNEVFADHESSRQPIDVPREWVWNLRRRALYCGTSVHSICRVACRQRKFRTSSGKVPSVLEDLTRQLADRDPLQRDFIFGKRDKLTMTDKTAYLSL
ncbi:hypothetical protein OROGR_022115 [Orobanche gracilis]